VEEELNMISFDLTESNEAVDRLLGATTIPWHRYLFAADDRLRSLVA
jgi:hypothetical protein